MKRFILLLPLALCACQSEAERKAEYMAFCTSHEFSPAQCEVLYFNKAASDSVAAQAGFASGMSGAAIGFAPASGFAAASGGRR